MAIYGGISIDISPSGPLTCTVLIDCVLAPLPPIVFGGITLRVTLGGTESGSDPILDWHRAVVVKVLGAANRGRRNVGIESATGDFEFATACAHRRRAGANMVWSWAIGCWRSFWEFECRSCDVQPYCLVRNRFVPSRLPSKALRLFARRVDLNNKIRFDLRFDIELLYYTVSSIRSLPLHFYSALQQFCLPTNYDSHYSHRSHPDFRSRQHTSV